MPKKVFWPVTLIIMGLIFMASNLNLLPEIMWNLWPLILILIGLGGLLTSDRDEWICIKKESENKKPSNKKKKVTKK
jgi:hypothetical protein